MRASLWSLLGPLVKDPSARSQHMTAVSSLARSRATGRHPDETGVSTPPSEVDGPNFSVMRQYAGAFGARSIWLVGGVMFAAWSLLSLLACWLLSRSGTWLSGEAMQAITGEMLPFIDRAAFAQFLEGAGVTIVIVVWFGVSAAILGLTFLASRLLRGRST